MQERRKRCARSGTVTLGMVVVSLGLYAFIPMDTMFGRVLATMDIREVWGSLIILSGVLLTVSNCISSRLFRSLSNGVAALVCGWTFILFTLDGVITPTIAACGIIAVGTLTAMTLDALESKKARESVRRKQYGYDYTYRRCR